MVILKKIVTITIFKQGEFEFNFIIAWNSIFINRDSCTNLHS